VRRFGILLGLSVTASLMAADVLKVAPPARAADLILTSKKIPLNVNDPAQVKVGELIYRGGVEIRSPNRDFGGLSGLRLWDDLTMLAVSDAGTWVSFRLVEKKGRLVGVKGIGIAPVLDATGTPGIKAERDVESVAIDRAAALVCITLERINARWCYRGIDPATPSTFAATPADSTAIQGAEAWPVNGGPEAADFKTTGSIADIVLSEEAEGSQPGTTAGFVSTRQRGDPEAVVRRGFDYPAPAGFRATDINILSDAEALVLNRHFTLGDGVSAIIAVLPLDDISAGHPAVPREIARLARPLTVDNMEGISFIERKGRRFIYIVSDDNFSGLQRTILMKFEWVKKAA
jgi:hypothetical protein